MNRKSFYIVLICLIVATFGFNYATTLRSNTIYEQTCPNGNCETIIKEYEYLPIEDDHSEDQNPTIDEDAAIVNSMTGIADDNAATDENTIYNRSIFVAGNNVTAQQLDINGKCERDSCNEDGVCERIKSNWFNDEPWCGHAHD